MLKLLGLLLNTKTIHLSSVNIFLHNYRLTNNKQLTILELSNKQQQLKRITTMKNIFSASTINTYINAAGIPVFQATWNNNDAAKKEIEQILEMKVGKRNADNEIYYKVNDYCNNFDMNSSAEFLYKKCYEQFKNVVKDKSKLDSIIWTVLD
mgnify:CR=1 FL=1